MVAGKAQIVSISTEIFYRNEQSVEDMKIHFSKLQKILKVSLK
jgi:hypothetical protein